MQEIANLEPELERRRQKYSSYGLTEQPLPVIVGPSIRNIHSCFVVVNMTMYSVETPVKAIDTCFKIIHALNAKYPLEAETTWTFLQKYVYDINTPYDKPYVSVNTLISEINRLTENTV